MLDRPEANPWALGRGGELEGVGEQVLKHGSDELEVGLRDQPILDLNRNTASGLGVPEFGDDLPCQLAHVDRHALKAPLREAG